FSVRESRIESRIPNPQSLLFTLARPVKPHEPAAARPSDETLQFEVEKPRQQACRREAGSLGNCIQIARLAGRQRGEHRVGTRGCKKGYGPFFRRRTQLLQDI